MAMFVCLTLVTARAYGNYSQFLGQPHNFTPGFDFAGVVVAAGASVKRLKVGDAVIGDTGLAQASFAEYVVCNENSMVAKPANISFVEAGGVCLAGLTALQALRMCKVTRSSTVAIRGASGGCGTFCLQLAKTLG
jgi:NADPH:quinone reductase-like Zn-dependent oxidoreductase